MLQQQQDGQKRNHKAYKQQQRCAQACTEQDEHLTGPNSAKLETKLAVELAAEVVFDLVQQTLPPMLPLRFVPLHETQLVTRQGTLGCI